MASRRAGNTLVELLVAMGMFGLILVVVVAIYSSGRDALRKTEVQSDPFRMAAIAQDHLKSELRGARVLCPNVPGDRAQLVLYQPQVSDPDHLPRFEPGSSPPKLRLRTDATILELVTNARRSRELIRRGGGRPDRKLADLGPGGGLELHFRDSTVADRVLSVSILASVYNPDDTATTSRRGGYRLDADFALTETAEVTPAELDSSAEQPSEPDEPDPDPEV